MTRKVSLNIEHCYRDQESFLADNLPAHPSTGRLKFHANFGGACSHGLICGCKGSFEPNYKVHLEKYISSKLDTFQRILVNFMREGKTVIIHTDEEA